MAKKKKKPSPRVPEVLRRLYGTRVKTLATSILSLISHPTASSPPSCSCIGSRPFGCLLCTAGESALPFLLRPNDPSEYRELLNFSYVVFSDNAPPLRDFRTDNYWSQHKIVQRVIEAVLKQQKRASGNVICVGYDKFKRSSPITELLTAKGWSLLLERVGDDVMIYLLKYASIFLPLPCSKYQQVAGFPTSNFALQILSKQKVESQSQSKRPLANSFEPTKKRARFTDENVMQHTSHCVKRCDQMDAPKAEVSGQKNHLYNDPEDSKHNVLGSRKRSCKWQRRRNLRRLAAKEDGEENSCSIKCNREVGFSKTSHTGCTNVSSDHYHEKVISAHAVTKGAEINRQPIFYCYGGASSVLPPKHVLKSLKPNHTSSSSLLQSIFGFSDVAGSAQSLTCSNCNASSSSRPMCLHHSLAKLLKNLIFRTQRCNHLKLLDKHCPVPSSCQDKDLNGKGRDSSSSSNLNSYSKPQAATDTQVKGMKSYCSKHQVISFIWAVSRNIVPPDLLGTPSSWRVLRRNIAKFIRLRRYEKFYLKQCMHELKTSSFPIFCNKHQLLEKWIVWFFSNIIVPLLQANFYITESEYGKQEVFYYRKSSWETLKNQTMACLEDKNYQTLNVAEVSGILKNRSFGFSKLRLVPKKNSMRVVANLKAASRLSASESSSHVQSSSVSRKVHSLSDVDVRHKYFKPVNCVLRDAHAVLRGMRSKEPEKFGSSVFDYNDIYKKLCPFITSLNRKPSVSSLPNVFTVVSDVSKAFDSVNQDKLVSILNAVLSEDGYLLKHVNQVFCTKKSLWVQEKASLFEPVNVIDSKRCGSSAVSSISSVLVNQGIERHLSRSEVMNVLKELVKRNVLRMGKCFYLQGMGIPQGSIVSSLLCSLYYGHLERRVIFPYLEKASKPIIEDSSRRLQLQDYCGNAETRYALLRFIDDFLLITTSKDQASEFFDKLKKGFGDYNCYMNAEKFCLNFDPGHESPPPSNRIYVAEDGASFVRWSGLLLNASTFEIQADYTRYLNNHLRSRLTIGWGKRPRLHMEKKLQAFMIPKCHPLFFDSNINTAPVVRLNVFQAFLISAMIFHCYVSEMSYICKFPAESHLKTIQGTWRYMHTLIKRRMQSLSSSSSGSCPSPVLRLHETEVLWLAMKAYIEVLKRKQSRHRVLLSMLRSKLSAHPISQSKNLPPELKFAVDRSNSSLLWKIKY
ncbi:unnamed protein product [Linum tenue]|uniref:Telomerase reverse transcriptase n=1 Tax=Linum tenue TaxID=586396 RepID=A0AAV0KBN5_9ROSI|nr:unnamed protein product [Linum tenue]